jgi:hypothetical protein
MADAAQNPTLPQSREPQSCWRLTFQYDGDRITLVGRIPLRKVLPPAAESRPVAGRNAGTWLELRAENEDVLFHRDIRRLIGAEVEVFHPDGRIQHVVGAPGRGQFEVVVPDPPRAAWVCVISSPYGQDGLRTMAAEVARFPLRG